MERFIAFRQVFRLSGYVLLAIMIQLAVGGQAAEASRERISINDGWRFMKYGPDDQVDELIYDVRPEVRRRREIILGEDAATAAVDVKAEKPVLKSWVMPTGNGFISDPTKRHARPEGNPGSDFPFVQATFNDASWEQVDLPHDWAIKGPFYEGWGAPVSGGMGRLPSPGVAWYRKKLDIPASDAGKSIFLDIDGAMSYATVWLNGKLVGGWPYGYNSWRVDLTPYGVPGGENQLAIRLDNPNDSSRWYSGGRIYRHVWLVKTSPGSPKTSTISTSPTGVRTCRWLTSCPIGTGRIASERSRRCMCSRPATKRSFS